MIRLVMMVMAFVASSAFVMTALSQPPEGGKDKKGQSGKEGKEGKGGFKGGKDGKGPPRFELGKVLPPFAIEELKLTKDQEKKIEELEKEVKAKLEKILTTEQKKQLENLRPMGGPGGPGGPGGKGGPPGGGPGGPPPGDAPMPRVVSENADAVNASGIQWFATWDSGRLEAERTGRAILLVSAAPHCAGVSGIW